MIRSVSRFFTPLPSIKSDEELILPELPLSEAMVKRDNYFHNCWVRLKLERPDLGEEMNKVELLIAGYDPNPPKKEEEETEEEPRVTL